LIDAAVATGKLDKRSRARADTSRHPNLFCIAVSVVSSSTLDHSTIQRLSFLLGAAGVVALLAAFWIWWRRNVYRRELPRVFELRDLVGQSLSPDAYFQSFEQSLSEIPQKLKQFRDIERDLQGLDADAWTFLKGEVAPLLAAKDSKRGWQSLFDKLNQAKAYNYLKSAGYLNIRFVPPSAVKGQQTPDLQADRVLCEVKTINISEIEANRRDSGGVGTSTDNLDEGFFRKLSSDLRKAKGHRQKVLLLPLAVPQFAGAEQRQQRRVAGQHAEVAVGSRDLDLVDALVHERPVGRHDLQLNMRRKCHPNLIPNP